jgi:peroxiredoxin
MRIRESSIRAAVLVGLVAVLGCGQSGPPAAPSAQQPVTKKPVPVDDKVQVATAKTMISPPSEAPKESPEPAAEATDDTAVPRDAAVKVPAKLPVTKPSIPLDEAPDAELTMPKVSLTQAHADICRVQVGADFPELELADLAGGTQSLAKLRGPELTVVVFWTGTKSSSRLQLADLEPDVSARFSGKGVTVVGINSGDDPQLAKELAEQAGARFAVLCDRDAAAINLVAPGKVPSTYLLDATGKVVWFDIEYSRTTRRELVQAIRFLLAQK